MSALVLAFGITGVGCSGDGKPAKKGQPEFSAAPCWGLIPTNLIDPILAPDKKVEVRNGKLDRWAKGRLIADCSGSQKHRGMVFNGVARWWRENPHKNPDSVNSWEPPAVNTTGLKVVEKDWAEAGQSWQWGARVAIRCDPPKPPPGAIEDYAIYKYLEVRVTGYYKDRDAYAKMTLALARGMVKKAGCTNKVDLTAS